MLQGQARPTKKVALCFVLQLSPFHRSTVFSETVSVTVCLSLSANTQLLLATMVTTANGRATSTTSMSKSNTGAPMGNFWLVSNLVPWCLETF